MNTNRTINISLFALLFITLCSAPVARAQLNNSPSAQAQQAVRVMASTPYQSGQGSPEMRAEMALMRKEKLQKKVNAQSAQLLVLAQKLNADVAKSNKNELSVSVVKEAAEIENLAKSIKKNAGKE